LAGVLQQERATGADRLRQEQWLRALLKKLIDNAPDACETAGVPPEIIEEIAR
jgi:hypothetical protein